MLLDQPLHRKRVLWKVQLVQKNCYNSSVRWTELFEQFISSDRNLNLVTPSSVPVIASVIKLSALHPWVSRKIDVGLEPPDGVSGRGLGDISFWPIRIEILMSLFAMYLVIMRNSVTELCAPFPWVLKKVGRVIGGERMRRAWNFIQVVRVRDFTHFSNQMTQFNVNSRVIVSRGGCEWVCQLEPGEKSPVEDA
jgi:hypothetical protein